MTGRIASHPDNPDFNGWNVDDYSAIVSQIQDVAGLFRCVDNSNKGCTRHMAVTIMANIWPYLRNPKDDKVSPADNLRQAPPDMHPATTIQNKWEVLKEELDRRIENDREMGLGQAHNTPAQGMAMGLLEVRQLMSEIENGASE
jgi:hypothetical protein